jgi:hypothetical protein
MNRNDRSTIVLGFVALLAVLAVTAPAPAMNDPVTGRWITRDPLTYNPLQVDIQLAAAQRPKTASQGTVEAQRETDSRQQGSERNAQDEDGGDIRSHDKNGYLLLKSQPVSFWDPLGSADCGATNQTKEGSYLMYVKCHGTEEFVEKGDNKHTTYCRCVQNGHWWDLVCWTCAGECLWSPPSACFVCRAESLGQPDEGCWCHNAKFPDD